MCMCLCTKANDRSWVGHSQSPSCEVTNHSITLVLNVNHHWCVGSGRRNAIWQISHLICTCMMPHMWIHIEMFPRVCARTHTSPTRSLQHTQSLPTLMHVQGLNKLMTIALPLLLYYMYVIWLTWNYTYSDVKRAVCPGKLLLMTT